MVDSSSDPPLNEKKHLDPQPLRIQTHHSDAEKTAVDSNTIPDSPIFTKSDVFTSSFDVDLESGTRNLTVPRSPFHQNASTPADIGATADFEQGLTNAVSRGRTRVQRRAERRAQFDPSYPAAQPSLRRASSLPARSPLTANHDQGGPHPFLAGAFNNLLTPARKLADPPGWKDSAINIIKYSYINVLLIFIPISWGCHFAGLNATVQFVFSFLAIIPCAALLGFATEELALRVGQVIGGLLNATFGNAVELIISILALVKGELRVVQASMLGSILSNCLLVLGMCFFAGGFRFHEQGYGIRAAQLNISLLSIAVFSIVIPAAFHSSLSLSQKQALEQTHNDSTNSVLIISRGTSIILLFVYAAYLMFQLWTHAYIYSPEASAHHSAQTHQVGGLDGPSAPPGQRVFRMPHLPSLPSITIYGHSTGSDSSSTSSSSSSSSASSISTIEGEEVPKLKLEATILLLFVITGLTGITAEYLVSSIDGLTATGNISREFVALILLPLVGNAAEHITAVTVSVKNKLDLAITVAVGSSIQIALFVIPFLVILGWIIGQPLSLFFDIFETVVVFVSILVVNYAISDGRTNWLEGMVLMVVYVLIALACWFYPGTGEL